MHTRIININKYERKYMKYIEMINYCRNLTIQILSILPLVKIKRPVNSIPFHSTSQNLWTKSSIDFISLRTITIRCVSIHTFIIYVYSYVVTIICISIEVYQHLICFTIHIWLDPGIIVMILLFTKNMLAIFETRNNKSRI